MSSITSFAANPAFLEQTSGKKKLVAADSTHPGFVNISWDKPDITDHRWSPPEIFGATASPPILGLSLLTTTVHSPGSLQVLVNANGKLSQFTRGTSGNWSSPIAVLPTVNVTGVPALIQNSSAGTGNFDLVSPASDEGVFQSYLAYGDTTKSWSSPISFGKSLGRVTAVSLVQGPARDSPTTQGYLEVVAIANGKLQYLYRDDSAFRWHGPDPILRSYDVTGNPALIISRFGTKGNFELVVPDHHGGLLHFQRNNDVTPAQWSQGKRFAVGLGVVTGVALLHSQSGPFPGALQVIANANGKLSQFWRLDGDSWVGPVPVESE